MMDSLFIKNKRRNGYQPCCSRNLLDRILLTMWHSLFSCQPRAASEISLIPAKFKGIVYNEHRKSTHSKADAPEKVTYLSMRGASPVDQTGGALFFSPVFPISVEKGKQRHKQTSKGHQQSQYPYENRDNLISRHKRHLPSYVFRQAGFIGSGGYHPVMGTLP